jgi:hypothetical protein
MDFKVKNQLQIKYFTFVQCWMKMGVEWDSIPGINIHFRKPYPMTQERSSIQHTDIS